MTAQTGARDIPVRKADVDAITAAIQVLGVAGLALESSGNLEAVKDALISGGYTGSRINTIANALTSGGYSAERLNDIKIALEAGGATYLLLQDLETLLTTIDADTSRIPASPATEDGNLASILAKIIAAPATEAHQAAPMAARAWVAEGASDAIAAGWEKVAITVPADSRRLGMFEVHIDTPAGLASLDYCFTHDAAGRYRLTNNETLALNAASLNPDGTNYSQCGSFGNVANKKPSFGVTTTIYFWHRGNAAAGNVVPVIHGEL